MVYLIAMEALLALRPDNCAITQLCERLLMYQSILSLTIPPRGGGKPWGTFLKGRIPPGQKNSAKTPPQGNYFKNPAKRNTKHETEVMKNNTEMLIYLEILKQGVKHMEAQSFLVDGFYGYSEYLRSFSIHL